jgi:hypothetical protein
MENDRCDIEFTYKTTNKYLDYIVGTPTYFVNAGTKYSITLRNIVPSKVALKSDSYSIDLTNSNNTWSATIPSNYTNKESFSVVLNDDTILYQGLLNYTMTSVNDLESQVSINTEDISLLKVEYTTIIESIQNLSASVNAKLEDLDDRVTALEDSINKEN